MSGQEEGGWSLEHENDDNMNQRNDRECSDFDFDGASRIGIN